MKKIIIFNSSEDSIDKLIDAKDKINGFYITKNYDGDIDALAYLIRSSEFWWYPLLSELEHTNTLLDETVSLDDAQKICNRFEKLSKKLKLNIDLFKKEEKLLFYMYLREDFELVPVFDETSLKLYKYPIVECLSSSVNDTDWLYDLVEKDFLEFTTLVDRIRLCTKCNSGHLYFIDLCQQCKSINIKKIKLLHCFSCGYVDDESNFQTQDGLVCPKCREKLKLIGVDYDLPASQYKCQECGYISEEALVEAKCISCKELNAPEKLNIYEFHKLKFTLFGREYLLLDQKKALFSIFSKNLRYVKIGEFKLFLNWIISASKRNKEFPFVVVLLRFSNMDEIIEHYGLTKTNEMFSELSKRLLELLRDTDILSVDDAYSTWILLPTTSKKGIEGRLQKAIENLQPSNGLKLLVDLKTFYSNEQNLGDKCEVDYIMETIKQKVD